MKNFNIYSFYKKRQDEDKTYFFDPAVMTALAVLSAAIIGFLSYALIAFLFAVPGMSFAAMLLAQFTWPYVLMAVAVTVVGAFLIAKYDLFWHDCVEQYHLNLVHYSSISDKHIYALLFYVQLIAAGVVALFCSLVIGMSAKVFVSLFLIAWLGFQLLYKSLGRNYSGLGAMRNVTVFTVLLAVSWALVAVAPLFLGILTSKVVISAEVLTGALTAGLTSVTCWVTAILLALVIANLIFKFLYKSRGAELSCDREFDVFSNKAFKVLSKFPETKFALEELAVGNGRKSVIEKIFRVKRSFFFTSVSVPGVNIKQLMLSLDDRDSIVNGAKSSCCLGEPFLRNVSLVNALKEYIIPIFVLIEGSKHTNKLTVSQKIDLEGLYDVFSDMKKESETFLPNLCNSRPAFWAMNNSKWHDNHIIASVLALIKQSNVGYYLDRLTPKYFIIKASNDLLDLRWGAERCKFSLELACLITDYLPLDGAQQGEAKDERGLGAQI